MVNPLLPTRVDGDFVPLKALNPLHIQEGQNVVPINDKVTTSFSDLFINALKSVNESQTDAHEKMQRFAVGDPNLDIHDITNAMSQAELSLQFLKATTDRVVTAYREIVNMAH